MDWMLTRLEEDSAEDADESETEDQEQENFISEVDAENILLRMVGQRVQFVCLWF